RECFETFEIEKACILRGAASAKLFAPSGNFLRVSKNEPQAYITDRAAFDRSLAERAQRAGAEYYFSTEATDIAVAPDHVRIAALDHGSEASYSAEAVVIASGFASHLPEKAGLGRMQAFIMGAQTEAEIRGVGEVEVYLSHRVAPGFFAWLVPVSDQRARIGLFAKEKPGDHLRSFMARLTTEGKILESRAPVLYGGIPLKPLRRTYGDRVLAVGDAAGQVKPTTGGGIYYGLLCADFAAETLHSAFAAGRFSANHLAHYEKLWKAKLGRELQIDYFARVMYNRLSDKRLNSIFKVVKENAIHEALLKSSYRSFDWHGELVLDGLKRLGPWRRLFGKYLPGYVLRSLRSKF
ncbi:MAG: NAD(P)/FAD-dependent oxidoreductase, partial [Chloroflexi bacterium]|nr:NAD(P)/FAD-dependent oxidoreductase [Chloroflexota bacterium]